jgi:polyferredoxin
VYSIHNNTNKKEVYYTVIAFILFNIMATLLYHYPSNKKEFINLLKNLSITGGFILLLDKFSLM